MFRSEFYIIRLNSYLWTSRPFSFSPFLTNVKWDGNNECFSDRFRFFRFKSGYPFLSAYNVPF
ncbi:hypothetical protein Zm00014a_022014 [Zea mays]|uniref:Uncharacterized protein n=1 Tax=Zea mays TaxID=4577 RepID=A0A317Y0R8_MAIZE|nr:hypothetical protein Zm00014a_022014 [Zea mays]